MSLVVGQDNGLPKNCSSGPQFPHWQKGGRTGAELGALQLMCDFQAVPFSAPVPCFSSMRPVSAWAVLWGAAGRERAWAGWGEEELLAYGDPRIFSSPCPSLPPLPHSERGFRGLTLGFGDMPWLCHWAQIVSDLGSSDGSYLGVHVLEGTAGWGCHGVLGELPAPG